MPNTLVHIGFQVPAVRAFARRANPNWILAGLVIPDVPWILLRAVVGLRIPIDPYAFHLYAIAQASLAMSLVLAAAVALATVTPRRVFALLGANVLLHLLLDATEIKRGNGVHLVAPFSWKLTSFGLVWPESALTMVLSTIGLVVGLWLLFRAEPRVDIPARLPGKTRLSLCLGLLAVYAIAPVALLSTISAPDAYDISVLHDRALRPGRSIEFDRARLVERNGQIVLRTFVGESLRPVATVPLHPGKVSAHGRFIDETTVALWDVHEHRGLSRELLSIVGLVLVAASWARALGAAAHRSER